MAVAIVQIPDTPTRLLKLKDAAIYCQIPIKRFPSICPVIPLDMGGGLRVYDIKDLDQWIDSLKTKVQSYSDDDILSKLEAAE